jgi:hypothetical protein
LAGNFSNARLEIPIKQSSVDMIIVITLTGSFSTEGESGLQLRKMLVLFSSPLINASGIFFALEFDFGSCCNLLVEALPSS